MVATWQNQTINMRKDSGSWQRKKRRKKRSRACWKKRSCLRKLRQIRQRMPGPTEAALSFPGTSPPGKRPLRNGESAERRIMPPDRLFPKITIRFSSEKFTPFLPQTEKPEPPGLAIRAFFEGEERKDYFPAGPSPGKERALTGQFSTQLPQRMQSALFTTPILLDRPGLVSMGQTLAHSPHSLQLSVT
jgi:hypothetical protein